MKAFFSSNKKLSMISAVAASALCLALVAVTQIDFLGGRVLAELEKAVTENLNVGLEISPLSGNPFVGFKGSGLALVRSGDRLLTIDTVEINLSLLSLVKNSPRVSLLALNGLKSDYDSLSALLPKKKGEDAVKDVPIDKIKLDNLAIASKWGGLTLNDSSVELRGMEWFAPVLKGTLNDIPFSLNGICHKKEGNWTLDGFSARLEDGSVKLSGALYPSPDFTGELKDVNLSTVASLFPDIDKYGVKGVLTASCSVAGCGRDMKMSGEGSLKEALVHGIPLEQLALKWKYDGGLIEADIAESRVFESSLVGRMILDARSPDKRLELTAHAKNLKFADWTDKLPEGMSKAMFLQGGISALSADLKGPLNALVGTIGLSPSTVSYNGMSFENFHGTAVFDGRPAGTVDFSAEHNGKKITLAGTCSFGDSVPTNLKLDADSVELDGLSAAFKSAGSYKLAGTASVKAVLEGRIGSWVLRADVSSPSVSVEKYGSFTSLRASPEYNFEDGSCKVKNMAGTWNGAKITASGTASRDGGKTSLAFNGNVSNFSTTKFYALIPFLKDMNIEADASGTWQLTGTVDSPKITAKIKTAGGRFRQLRVDRFAAYVRYLGSSLVLDPINLSAAGGAGVVKCTVNMPEGSPVTWKAEAKFKDVDAAALNGLLMTSSDIGGACTGSVTVGNDGGGLKWAADFIGEKIRWQSFRADTAKGRASGNAEEINIDGIKASFLKGEHDLKGRIILAASGRPAEETRLELKGASKNINIYELLRRYMPAVRGVQGLIEATYTVGGTVGAPSYKGAGTFAPLRYRGFLLPMVDIDFNGNLKEINITSAETRLHSGSLGGKGRAFYKDGEWHGEIDASGSAIDLKQLGAYLPTMFRERLGGKADFKFTGKGELGSFDGKGYFSSDKMRILGVHINDLKAPFFVSEGYAVIEDLNAVTNNGTLHGGAALDLNDSIWGGNITVMSADVEPMLKQAFPNLKGTLSGKGDLKVRAGGETGRLSTVKGGGVLFLHDGEVKSFDAVEAAQKYTKGKPLRYKELETAFTYDGGYLTILPGSQAVAPEGDTVYRYVMLDGIISEKKELGMFAMGKVNIRALNALLGALQGVISAGMDFNTTGSIDKGELLQNFLGGILSGYARTDFRFVTLNIGGTIDSPAFSNIKVDKASRISEGKDVIPKSASDPDEKSILNDNTTFRLKFEIPVGPGKNKTPDAIQGQVVEQTLGNIIHNLNLGF